jgi:hypothetical protein
MDADIAQEANIHRDNNRKSCLKKMLSGAHTALHPDLVPLFFLPMSKTLDRLSERHSRKGST